MKKNIEISEDGKAKVFATLYVSKNLDKKYKPNGLNAANLLKKDLGAIWERQKEGYSVAGKFRKYHKNQTRANLLIPNYYLGDVIISDKTMISFERAGQSLVPFLKNKNDEFFIRLLKQEVSFFKYIQNQTPEICLEVVKRDGWALKYVKNQSIKICLAALKNDPGAYEFVKIVPNPDFETTLNNLKKKQLVLEALND